MRVAPAGRFTADSGRVSRSDTAGVGASTVSSNVGGGSSADIEAIVWPSCVVHTR
jgi:hypothetical protein